MTDAQRCEPSHAGLCASCGHAERVVTTRSNFYLCGLSFTEPRFARYPPLPVLACPGYERVVRECVPGLRDAE